MKINQGGIKGRSKPEFIKTLEIPLPSIDDQNAIVAQIEKQKAIIEGADLVLKNWEMNSSAFTNGKTDRVARNCF